LNSTDEPNEIDINFIVKIFIIIGLFIVFNVSFSMNSVKYNYYIVISILVVLLFIILILLMTGIMRGDEGFKNKGKKGKKGKKSKGKSKEKKDNNNSKKQNAIANNPTALEPIKKKSNFSSQTIGLFAITALGIIATIGNVVWKSSN
jgi:hypothetical protein